MTLAEHEHIRYHAAAVDSLGKAKSAALHGDVDALHSAIKAAAFDLHAWALFAKSLGARSSRRLAQRAREFPDMGKPGPKPRSEAEGKPWRKKRKAAG